MTSIRDASNCHNIDKRHSDIDKRLRKQHGDNNNNNDVDMNLNDDGDIMVHHHGVSMGLLPPVRLGHPTHPLRLQGQPDIFYLQSINRRVHI